MRELTPCGVRCQASAVEMSFRGIGGTQSLADAVRLEVMCYSSGGRSRKIQAVNCSCST